MSPMQRVQSIVDQHNGDIAATVERARSAGLTKMQMTRVASLIGVDKSVFWASEKSEPLPADYWSVIENVVRNPEKYEDDTVIEVL